MIKLKKFFCDEYDRNHNLNEIKAFRRSFRASFDNRIKIDKGHVVAHLLDPQMKYSVLIEPYIARFTDGGASALLYEELNQSDDGELIEPRERESANESPKRAGADGGPEGPPIRSDVSLLTQIHNYLTGGASGRSDLEVTEFWSRKHLDFSDLAKLFKRVGCLVNSVYSLRLPHLNELGQGPHW